MQSDDKVKNKESVANRANVYTSNMTGFAAPFSLKLGGNTNAEVPMVTCRLTVSLKLATCFSIAALSTFKSKFIKKQKPIRGNKLEKIETFRARFPAQGAGDTY